VSLTTPDPRSIRDEAEWIRENLSVVELAGLKASIESLGYSPQVAAGLVGWIVDKAAGRPDQTGAPTRARYRKILAELAPSAPEPSGSGRRGRGDRGEADLRSLLTAAGVGLSAATALAAGRPLLALVAAPIILDPSVTSSDLEVAA
jgi:hypothetical protein